MMILDSGLLFGPPCILFRVQFDAKYAVLDEFVPL